MDMIGHDNEFVDGSIGMVTRDFRQILICDLSEIIINRASLIDPSEKRFHLFCANRDEIPTGGSIIPGAKARRFNSVSLLEFQDLSPLHVSVSILLDCMEQGEVRRSHLADRQAGD